VLAPPGCYLNHSCDPNAMRHGVKVFAWRPIAAGDEVTIDYRLNAFDGSSWPCECGAESCTGTVEGSFFAMDPERQTLLLPHAPRSSVTSIDADGKPNHPLPRSAGTAAVMSLMVTPERAAEYHGIVRSVTAWADGQQDITGIAAVGSWARDEPRMDSDLDLVILTVDKQRYSTDGWWVPGAVGQQADVVRTQDWGPLTERRVVLQSGFEIEFGFAAPSWASTEPLDAGTARVVRDGCLPLHDPSGAFELLIAAVRAT
jgi:hypothetical protein